MEEDLDEKQELIKDRFAIGAKNTIYEYDFGDGWEHTVVLENILESKRGKTYPLCTAGKSRT